MARFLLCVICFLSSSWLALAQESKTYTDAQGRSVFFPLGEISFADEVVSFKIGNPAPKNKAAREIGNILDEPINASLSLGCNGVVIVRFIDNTLVNIEGPDLYIFEIGKKIESTILDISTDGKEWINVGVVAGSTAAIDISKYMPKSAASFQYVRLTDRNINCYAGKYSGADIDAVGAIGAAIRITLNGNVLFDFDSSDLREDARSELESVIESMKLYPNAHVVFEGHTDAQGSFEYNNDLSSARAESVRDYLVEASSLTLEKSNIKGYGESRPVASNDTEEGQQKNRRVDLLIIPQSKN